MSSITTATGEKLLVSCYLGQDDWESHPRCSKCRHDQFCSAPRRNAEHCWGFTPVEGTDMTVEEIKLMRKSLESDIRSLLQQFQRDTGLQPVAVELQNLSNHRMGLPTEGRVIQVKVEAIL